MIKIKRTIKATSDISMASMSDIAFLLIIFFMVASTFIIKEGLHLTLPDRSRNPMVMSSRDVIVITLTTNGKTFYNNESVNEQVIEERLIKAKNENKGIFVLLKIPENIKYIKAIDVIDKIKFSGIKKLSIRMI